MKTVQKLEIAFGIATLFSTTAYYGLVILPLAKFYYQKEYDGELYFSLVGGFLLVVLPGILRGLGAYLWASKKSSLGFAAIMLGGTITALYFGAYLFTGAVFYYHGRVLGLIAASPFLFATLTLVFAFRCRKLFLSPN